MGIWKYPIEVEIVIKGDIYLQLILNGLNYKFHEVPLDFQQYGVTDIFSVKNSRNSALTLKKRLNSKKYNHITHKIQSFYSNYENTHLGTFLHSLKSTGDNFYREFLNDYGDSVYCSFRMGNSTFNTQKGLYLFALGDTISDIRYIGSTVKTFQSRIQQGYGTISPKNCYIDGQLTNCRLNVLIGRNFDKVKLFVCPISGSNTKQIEKGLIRTYTPSWDFSLNKRASFKELLEMIKPYVYVVGSYSEGTQCETSDIDLYIKPNPNPNGDITYTTELLNILKSTGWHYRPQDNPYAIWVTDTPVVLDFSHLYSIPSAPLTKPLNIWGVDMEALA